MDPEGIARRWISRGIVTTLVVGAGVMLVWWFAFCEPPKSIETRVAEEIRIMEASKSYTGMDYYAAVRIAELGPDAVPYLIAALHDGNPKVRKNVVYALGKIGPEARDAIPELIAAMSDTKHRACVTAIESLGRIGPDAIPALIDVLSGKTKGNRGYAAAALGRIGPDAAPAVPVLIETIQSDQDDFVIESAVRALGYIGPPAKAAVPSLLALNSGEKADFHTFCYVLDALRRIVSQDEEFLPLLVTNLNSEDERTSRTAAGVVYLIGPAAVPPLIEALNSEVPHVRTNAAFSLGYCGQRYTCAKEVVPALAIALKDRNARGEAAAALGKIGPDAAPAVSGLIVALDDDEWPVRSNAAQSLGEIGPASKPAVPQLIAALGDEEKHVRSRAAHALGKVGPDAKDAVPALIVLLADQEKNVRSSAARALGEIGSDAKAAVPALTAALSDEESQVQQTAEMALQKIR